MENKKFIEFIDENGIEYSMPTILSPLDDFMPCTFKNIGLDGKPKPCTFPVPKNKIDKKNGNNNYCEIHQEVINKINEARKSEVISKYKEKLMLFLDKEIFNNRKLRDNETNYTEFSKDCSFYFDGRRKMAEEIKTLILKGEFNENL